MPRFNHRTVLVVDNDKDILDFIAEKIAGLGPTVHTAKSGDEAIRLIEKLDGDVDLLLSDVVMPGMSGLDLVESLAHKAPETKVVMMSGFIQPAINSDNKATYEEGFMKKPFSGKTLLTHVRKALNELENN